jgi:hypothetical protein
MAMPPRADGITDAEYLRRANRTAAGLGIPNRYTMADVREVCWEIPVKPDGWTEWVHPLPNYRMQCCDCGLIHEMEFAIADHCKDGVPLNEGEDSTHIIVFRARRAVAATSGETPTPSHATPSPEAGNG